MEKIELKIYRQTPKHNIPRKRVIPWLCLSSVSHKTASFPYLLSSSPLSAYFHFFGLKSQTDQQVDDWSAFLQRRQIFVAFKGTLCKNILRAQSSKDVTRSYSEAERWSILQSPSNLLFLLCFPLWF